MPESSTPLYDFLKDRIIRYFNEDDFTQIERIAHILKLAKEQQRIQLALQKDALVKVTPVKREPVKIKEYKPKDQTVPHDIGFWQKVIMERWRPAVKSRYPSWWDDHERQVEMELKQLRDWCTTEYRSELTAADHAYGTSSRKTWHYNMTEALKALARQGWFELVDGSGGRIYQVLRRGEGPRD